MGIQGNKEEAIHPITNASSSDATGNLNIDPSLDILFAQNFTSSGGKFIYTENIEDLISHLHSLKSNLKWNHIFKWETELIDLFDKTHFQKGAIGFNIENSDVAISLCESLVADDGSIVLTSKQASRRSLPVFPKTHIIVASSNQIVANFRMALDLFKKNRKDELPSIIDLGKELPKHIEVDGQLILNAVGPKDIYVFLTDEPIEN